MQASIRDFLKLESAAGIILMVAAVLAMIVANSPLREYYDLLLEVPVEIRIGALHIAKPFILWVNDGLMAIFFFLVGLELKREVVEGELSRPANIFLPALGAVGGIAVPVAIYVWFNSGDPAGMRGWAIPAATDIAFALGILMLLGKRVPVSLKVFLVSLAIFDDLGAIAIIALFFFRPAVPDRAKRGRRLSCGAFAYGVAPRQRNFTVCARWCGHVDSRAEVRCARDTRRRGACRFYSDARRQ